MSEQELANDRQGAVVAEKKPKTKEPSLYKVLLHNDDYTTMEFVIMVLQVVFHKETMAATEIMLSVHNKGVGVAGIYTREVAETKVALVHELAKKNQHPLRCSMEKA
jgi:ATP-dependent Clp protease adaptor protein ClpS